MVVCSNTEKKILVFLWVMITLYSSKVVTMKSEGAKTTTSQTTLEQAKFTQII